MIIFLEEFVWIVGYAKVEGHRERAKGNFKKLG